MKKIVIIAPHYRAAEHAARFILEVSPRSCIIVCLDGRGSTEKLHGLRQDSTEVHYFTGRRVVWNEMMRMNHDIMRIMVESAQLPFTQHNLP